MTDLLSIAGHEIAPGEDVSFDMELAPLVTHTQLTMPVRVLRGKKPGPVMFVNAALHGDEVIGVEIIRRLGQQKTLKKIRGTLILVPVVNVFGFIHRQRYTPDRRDINRSFPGTASGSLASRICHLFTTEILAKCTHGVDLHSGATGRENLPQIRACLNSPGVEDMALAFNTPVILNAPLRTGSLRETAQQMDTPTLVFESGEALRFHEVGVKLGVRGILRVMRYLGMLPQLKNPKPGRISRVAHGSKWIRAATSGLFSRKVKLGQEIMKDQILGCLHDPLGESKTDVVSPSDGLLIGASTHPLVHEGDALAHIAFFDKPAKVAEEIRELHQDMEDII